MAVSAAARRKPVCFMHPSSSLLLCFWFRTWLRVVLSAGGICSVLGGPTGDTVTSSLGVTQARVNILPEKGPSLEPFKVTVDFRTIFVFIDVSRELRKMNWMELWLVPQLSSAFCLHSSSSWASGGNRTRPA